MGDLDIINNVHSYQSKIKGFKFVRILCIIVSVLVVLSAGIFGSPADYDTGSVILLIAVVGVCFLVLIIMVRLMSKTEKQLKAFIGENITKQILAQFIWLTGYEPLKYMPENEMRESGALPSYNQISGSDYVKGTYKGKEVEFCDLKLEYEESDTDSDGNTTTSCVTVFQGHLLKIRLGRHLDGGVRVLERRVKRKKKGSSGLMNSFWSKMGLTPYQDVEMEDEEFNRAFGVKAQNPHTAFYILTPHFMQSIIRMDRIADAHTNICFVGDYAYISLDNGRDLFEIKSAFENVESLAAARNRMYQDMRYITAVMDEILQNEYLFQGQ